MEDFGKRLKELRQAAKITQSELSERLNIHPQTVSKWERGLSEPDIAQLGDLAASLGITLEKLLGQEEADQTYAGNFQAEAFGKMLSSLRAARGESQEELAASMSSSADAVSRWERGVTCPDIERLSALAAHFAVPVSKLYCGFSETQPPRGVAVPKRRRRLSAVRIAAAALLFVACILLFAFLFRPSPGLHTVMLDGRELTVSENDWFVPQTPERDGYDFVCWVDEQGEEASFPCKIEGNCAFTAVFTPHEYALDYWLNGGYFVQTPQNTFTVESGAAELAVPKKEGAVFEGWYLTADYSGQPVTQVRCAGADIKLYAKWSDAACSVRYELCGGILYGDRNPQIVTSGEEVALKEPVRSGYVFLGWYDQPQGGQKYETIGGAQAKNLTLYALWQKCDDLFTVYYDLNGGDAAGENPVSVGAGEAWKLSGAEKGGYDFIGWNTQEDGGGEYVEYLYGVDDALHLYAIFEPKEYVVRYIFEGSYEGSETNPNTVTYGESVQLLPVHLYGHEFIGWFNAETGGEQVDVIDTSNILTVSVLYARFAPLEFSLKLDARGGSYFESGERKTGGTYSVLFGEEFSLPACTLEGHDFLGWNEEPDGSGQYYTSFAGMEGNQALYAVYAAKEYMIRYEYEGLYEDGKVNPNYVTYGSSVTLYPVYLTGYTFAGWFDAEEGGARVDVIDASNILRLSVLYARFTPLEYAVTLDACGGTFATPEGEQSAYTYLLKTGQTFDLPACTRSGFAFLGWRDAEGNAVQSLGPAYTGEVTLTAAWMQTGVEYSIRYELDGGEMREGNPSSALSDVCLTLSDPVREGYVFLGWFDNAEGAGEPYLCTPFGREEDLTLYALWQELKVSGSAEYFDYEKTSSAVTVTGYHGPLGENVDVVIPSVIDGLPVTQIGSNIVAPYGANTVRYSIFGAPDSASINSLTIPEGVLVLKDSAFRTLKVQQPVQIPSSVHTIGANCFEYFGGEVRFAENGALTSIGSYAFARVRFLHTLVIPYGVKTIGSGAFYNVKVTSVILPDTVETIFDQAFYQPNHYIQKMFIPSSVKYVGFMALTQVYTSLSLEQAEGIGCSAVVYDVQKSTLTLIDGEERQILTGEAFALPRPQREGYTFLGWQDESGAFVGDCYIPNRDASLVAVYEKQTGEDGRSPGTAALIAADIDCEFILLDGQRFYFRLDESVSCQVILSVKGDFWFSLYYVRDNSEEPFEQGKPLAYRAGDLFYLETDSVSSGTAVTIKFIRLA